MQPLPPPPTEMNSTTTGIRPPRLPTGRHAHATTHHMAHKVPASISCHEVILPPSVRNDYSVPGSNAMPTTNGIIQPVQIIQGTEGFYAATDIVLKVSSHHSLAIGLYLYINIMIFAKTNKLYLRNQI